MSIVERPKSMTETAMAKFEAKQAELAVLKTYGALTLAVDGIGKIEEAHKAVKRAESELEKDRVELKAPALAFGKLVDTKAKELQAILDPIEKHLKAQRDIHDAEKLKEKQAKEAAKAAVLNDRVIRLSAAGIHVTDLRMIEGMSADEFEFFFAKESRIAAEAKAEAERLEALRQEEIRRQAEEIRIRAEEIERQRLADEAAMAEERRQIEADRAEMRRQQEELQKHQAELRAKAEAEAAEERRRAAEAEKARREAAAFPELEKLETVLKAMKNAGSQALSDCGVPRWSDDIAEHFEKFSENCRQTVVESLL